MALYKINPSALTYTWDGCKHCFYMEVKHKITVKTPFPGIFSRMSSLTSEFYLGAQAHDLSPDLPPGIVSLKERNVKSAPISVPGIESQCYISGRFDAVIEFEDASYAVVDYKTSDPREEHAAFYARQLTAYAYALENPAPGALGLSPVRWLGLFVITPERFERNEHGEVVYVNRTTWMNVPRDDAAFMALIAEVLAVLDAPQPPPPSETCGLCGYRQEMSDAGF